MNEMSMGERVYDHEVRITRLETKMNLIAFFAGSTFMTTIGILIKLILIK